MSRFISPRYEHLEPYIPGEQPKDKEIIKLNANETSMPPSPRVLDVLQSSRMERLGRYTDPSSMELKRAIAKRYGVRTSEILVGNGSDEMLGLIFLAFFEQARIAFPDVTYGFYETMAKSFGIDYAKLPLRADFTVDVNGYVETDRHIVLANPNAPTGYVLPVSEIERIVAANPQRLVVIDEAYVDYGNESCVPLIHKYDNLIVVQTMSKSRNLAGAHVGYCFASAALIQDLEGLKAAFIPLPRAVLERLPDLSLISINAAGYNTVDVEAAQELGIAVERVPDYCTEEVATHTMALLLALARHLKAYDREIEQEHVWKFQTQHGLQRLSTLTIAVFGWGRIGRRVAELARQSCTHIIEAFAPPRRRVAVGG